MFELMTAKLTYCNVRNLTLSMAAESVVRPIPASLFLLKGYSLTMGHLPMLKPNYVPELPLYAVF